MKKRILKLALFICIVSTLLALVSITASAASSGKGGTNLTWSLDDNRTLTISGSGAMYNYSSSDPPWYSSRSNIVTVKIEDGVTSIGDYAFSGCKSLTSITIPDSVTSIGDYAFSGCTSLEEINWNAKNVADFSSNNFVFAYAGQNGSGIKVTFGNNVETIPAYLFYPNTNLSYSPKIISVSIGNGVTSIGDYAFSGCTGLTSITIPDSVIRIGSSAFQSCTSLEKITLPFVGFSRDANGTANALFGYIFGNESGITITQYYSPTAYSTYKIPSTLKNVTITDADIIPYGAFYNCSNLDNITLNSGISAIYSNSFYNCSNLMDITIMSQSVKISRSNVFEGCDMLTIHGIKDSDIEEYAAKYELDFEPIDESAVGITILTASAEVIEGKIVVTAKSNGITSKKFMPVAVYDKDNVMLDLIIIPTNEDSEVIKVVFKDIKDASFVKLFMWNSYDDLAPLDTAKEVTIVRNSTI